MEQRNMSMGGDSIDWNDPAFSTSEFQDSMTAESPWGNTAFNDFTNLADYSDSPAAPNFRTPSKSGPEPASNAGVHQQGLPGAGSTPAESSSQDSASDSSSRRKRKTTESPISDPLTDGGMRNVPMKTEDMGMGTNNFHGNAAYEQAFGQPLPNLNVDASMAGNDDVFDFNSAASSPNLPRDFNNQLSLDQKMNVPSAAGAAQFPRGSPVTTINPGMFTLGGASRDQSPVANAMMFNTASPNAIFSTPSSDSNDTYNANANWNTSQNPAWPNDFNSQFTSPGGLAFTPSPVIANGTPAMSKRAAIQRGRSKLHIAPISTKSRVETQINVVMTLETPPPNIEHLHLPLHTIAKSKLLAKEDVEKSRTLELHTMLVCTSAMHNPQMKEKALQRAAVQNNDDIQKRAEEQRKNGDDEKNNMKDVDEADKAANGGEVRICNNCIQRERKRAGRKKLKREEEQQHWERYETERVVVFNSNEYLPFKAFEPSQQPQKEGGMGLDEPYNPPEGAISVAAAMRIACYCRHQSEKEGFQVIFTMKDQQGNVVAQEMSDSILITDDHKTHPPTLTPMSSEMIYPQGVQYPYGMTQSVSMVNLSSHAHPFTSSRSTGNLQALNYREQYNPQSHIHQLQTNQPYASQTTSATMTPTSLSRPGSPNSAGQTGPNKKRKSSNFGVPAHRRLPSGLQMTPRVDTGSQPSSATGQPGMNMASNFSPSGPAFPQQNDQSFMTIPQNNGPAQYYGSGPPTPANEQAPFNFGQPHQLDIARAQNASAYFSHPSSAVPSRSNSPVLQQRQYARQPIQTPTNHVSRPSQQMFANQTGTGAGLQGQDPSTAPSISKITPNEGPLNGGTEVSIFGYNFTHGTQVFFGSSPAPTTFYGSQCILAISPPGQRGPVQVRLTHNAGSGVQYASPQLSNQTFTYTDTNARMMEMALRFLSQQQTGDSSRWVQYTNEVANQFMQTSISPAGIPGQGFEGGNMMSMKGLDEKCRGVEGESTCGAVHVDEDDRDEHAFSSPGAAALPPAQDPNEPKMPGAAATAGLGVRETCPINLDDGTPSLETVADLTPQTSIPSYITALRSMLFAAVIPHLHQTQRTPLTSPAFVGMRQVEVAA